MVVPAEADSVRSVGIPSIAARHRNSCSVRVQLIGDRPFLDETSHQVAVAIQTRACALESQPYLLGIDAGLHQQVVFELVAVAVIDQIDTGIETVLLELSIV